MATNLIATRGRIIGAVSKFKTFASNINDETSISAIETRLVKLEESWKEFRDIEIEIFAADPAQISKFDEFSDKFFDTKSIMVEWLTQKKRNVAAPPQSDSTFEQLLEQQRIFLEGLSDRTMALNERSMSSPPETVRLPKVNIEPFNGNYSTWPSFQDLYVSSVHNHPSLSNSQKFQLLKGVLRGEPAELIRHFTLTDANYLEAWDKLNKRYNKPNTILQSLIKTYIDQPRAAKGSLSALRNLCDTSDQILRGIKALGTDAESRNPWLVHILLDKVDLDIQEAWANKNLNNPFPTIYEFIEFICNKCDSKEGCTGYQEKSYIKHKPQVKSFQTSCNTSCPYCNQLHSLTRCIVFKKMPILKRRSLVTEINVCFNCLNKGHSAMQCSSKYSCRICNKRHNTLLHHYNIENSIHTPNTVQHQSSNSNPAVALSQTTQLDPSHTSIENHIEPQSDLQSYSTVMSYFSILPTALVGVYDKFGNLHSARVLLDSGSQSCFVKESLVSTLQLPRRASCVTVTCVGETKAATTNGSTQLILVSKFNTFERFSINALILKKVTSKIPQTKIDKVNLEKLQGLQLADPLFNTPSDIDIILGADIFFKIMEPQKIEIDRNFTAQYTKFGWILAGSVNPDQIDSQTCLVSMSDEDINLTLQRFWSLEDVPENTEASSEELQCEEYYKNTTRRESNGRYIVRLPFKKNQSPLGNSKSTAISRLFAMEKKFKNNAQLAEQYNQFLDEYLKLEHMTLIPPANILCPDNLCFYLPHHAVFKNDSTTTKLRVVFDGSCKSSSGTSLNQNLLTGPTLQNDLISILIKFRTHRIAFSADIEKMYRQVLVDEKDCNFQRIVWRENTSVPINHYWLKTITYGTSCAPYLAVRTLNQIANENQNKYPIETSIIKTDFYIDDLLSGSNSIEEAIALQTNISKILLSGGFNLRKWRSNSKEFLDAVNSSIEPSCLNIQTETCKTLGLKWSPITDTFSYKINIISRLKCTKRELLSDIAKIFDPLGLITPTTIMLKILMQKLWLRKLGWDEYVPEDLSSSWNKLYPAFEELQKLEIPRYIMSANSNLRTEIHGFSDASENAYACVVYLRTTQCDGSIQVRIIASKARVAPLKQVSLPRLELCGALLLSKLLSFLINVLKIDGMNLYAWTDSKIVLDWLSDHPRKWTCFVGNRTAEILRNIPFNSWNHVSSKTNPADLASRGVNPTILKTCNLWWYGPDWLALPNRCWPNYTPSNEPITVLEKRTTSIVAQSQIKTNIILEELFQKISSFRKIQTILGYILMFRKQYRLMSSMDLERKTQTMCIKFAQMNEFSKDIQDLIEEKQINSKSKLIKLNPFLDQEGILRVGGRLANLEASFNIKHPMILPKGHQLTKMIITEEHIRNLHPGPTLLTCLLRQKYWILDCRNQTRFITNKCIKCFRYKSAIRNQLMGSLPKARITPSRPFLHTGVDYAGPIYLKTRSGKGRIVTTKGYICIFICFSTKAVHIELASDMTSQIFIATLRRFISRRGIPSEIYSDNGTNFVGAKRELKELYDMYNSIENNQNISKFLLQNEIKFNFNPPRSPHFGGLWEANIKSIKHHLHRVTNSTLMTFEEMTTLLVQIEALLNSRPLSPLSNEVDDLCALTPSHFLIGEPLTAIPEPTLLDVAENRLSKYQNIQNRVQGFWQRWSIEYLHNLQQRPKWHTEQPSLQINDLVLIREDNLPPSKWLLGRIISLHPGNDGLIRVVTVKTAAGELKRPIVKICKLPA